VTTPEERSARARKAAETRFANTTPEQRSEEARRAAQKLTPEERRARSVKAAASMTPEERSTRSRRAAAALTPEERSARSRKAAETRRARTTPEERAAVARHLADLNRPPWTAKMLEVLGDGEWHDIAKVVRAATPLVPPQAALDYFRRNIVGKRVDTKVPNVRVKAVDTAQQVRDGKWAVCRRVLSGWKVRGMVEYDGVPATRVRLLRRDGG
jgi:hypothetical protein